MRKTTRMVMVGILCVGLLLIGIGIGIFGLEFSQLTYGGMKTPEGETTRKVETFQVAAGDTPIWIETSMQYPRWDLDALTKIKVNEGLAPGVIQVAVTYRSVPGTEIWMSGNTTQECTYITLSHFQSSTVATLLAYKDWILDDLKDQEWCEYVPLDVEAVEITVNPADRQRIHLLSSDCTTMVYGPGVNLDESSLDLGVEAESESMEPTYAAY